MALFHKLTGSPDVDTNQQPIIGIVTQAIDDSLLKVNPKFADYNSYMMADYAQYIEGSGARVIPIVDTESDETTLAKLGYINGVLLPGGAGDDQYEAKARFIYEKAIEINDGGVYFPLWGTC